MVISYLRVILICAAAIAVGILLGNGAVYFFNKMPGTWLTDYGQTPSEELLHPTKQRIRSTPWKYVFTGFFITIGIYLGIDNLSYAIPALVAIWLLVEMSAADIKYMIVPDQLIILLATTGIGFIPHHEGGPLSGIWGALLGFGVVGLIAVLGRLIYRRTAVGGGDVKIFGALGLACGLDGVIFVFIVSTFLSAGHFVWLLMRKKAKPGDERPMVPYIAAATILYMVFFHTLLYNNFIDITI